MKTFIATVRRTKSRFKSVILAFLIAAVIIAAVEVVTAMIRGEMNEAALAGYLDDLFRLMLLTSALMALRAAAAAVSALLRAYFSANAGYKLRESFMNHFLRTPFKNIEKLPAGERLSVYQNDIPKAQGLISSDVMDVLTDFITFVSAFAFLIFLNPAFTGILALSALGMLLLMFLLSRPINKWSERQLEEKAKYNAVLNDSLQNLSVVTAYSLDEVLEERFARAYAGYYKVVKRFALAFAFMAGTMMSVLATPLIVIIIVMGRAVIGDNMSLGEYVAFIMMITTAAGSLTMLGQRVARVAESAAGAKRLNDNTADELEELSLTVGIPEAVEISFENVSFSYGESENKDETKDENEDEAKLPALDGVSFKIPAGSRVALAGGSGSGKSTIIKLLLGLYEPTDGKISVGDKNLSKAEMREIFAYVPQDSFLFPESIGKNITLGDEAGDIGRLERACADAGILDFINSLPDRFDAVLTESAENISGGERQRIALARAFYKNAPVILFDEATSSLDPVTEAEILESLNRAARGKTVIMAAHRESAVKTCDIVINLDGGRTI